VDFPTSTIRVRKAVKVHGSPVLEDLKTERSRRTLEMPAAVASMLAAQRRDQAAARLRAEAAYADHGLVLARDDGRPCWPVTVRAQFRRLCKAAGLGEGWHPHEQRHTFVSVLSHAGVNIEQIADAAGHINSNVTKSVYRHQIADKVSVAAKVMDATFRATGGAS
jgi:integrase